MKKSVAPSTWRARRSQWKCYSRFCVKFNLSKLPCSSDQLSLYATHLSEHMSHNSIIVYLQAVVFASKLMDYPIPTFADPCTKSVLEGAKRSGPAPGSGAVPVTVSVLRRLFSGVDLSSRAAQVFWASCLLMFFSLLRISHVVDSVHSIKCKDLSLYNWGYMLTIRSSKTLRAAKPILLPVCSLPDKRFCPVYWISKLHNRKDCKSNSNLFSCMRCKKFTYSMFRSSLDLLSESVGLGKKFSGHSFRKGGAQYLVSMGVPLSQVQERGNWKSLCVLRYLSSPIEDRVSVERALAARFC